MKGLIKRVVIASLVMVMSVMGTGLVFAGPGGKGMGGGINAAPAGNGTGTCPYGTVDENGDPVYGGGGRGYGMGFGNGTGVPTINIFEGEPVTVSGTVSDVGYYGQGIQIDTGNDVVAVYGIGPFRYWDSLDIDRPAVGESITVNGYTVTFSDGSAKIIAASVTIGEETVELRDEETGAPLWRGRRW